MPRRNDAYLTGLLASVMRSVATLGRVLRRRGRAVDGVKWPQLEKKLKQGYGRLLRATRQVVHQTKARVLGGQTRGANKLVSLFEPTTEVIRKGKASKPTEFGKMVKIQEAENQIITHDEVFEKRPSDAELLVPAVDSHQRQFGQVPNLVAADAGFYSAANERTLDERGVQQVSIPNYSTKSAERRRHQRKRWFRRGQKWRTGCEGRISLLKRRHGLNRCRYRGDRGMQRWVGFGVIADHLINIGRFPAANNSGWRSCESFGPGRIEKRKK